MTAPEEPELACSHMYDAAGVVARELAIAIDALAAMRSATLEDVCRLRDEAETRAVRAYEAAAWVRERYG